KNPPPLNRLLQNQSAAVPEKQTDSQRAKNFDDRKKHGVVPHAAQQDVAIAVVDLLEAAVHLRFLAEGLNRSDPGDVLLQLCIEPCQDQPAFPVDLARAAAIKSTDIENRRKCRETNERELPVQPEHDRCNADDSEQIPQQPNNTGAEKLVERFDVVEGWSRSRPCPGFANEKISPS